MSDRSIERGGAEAFARHGLGVAALRDRAATMLALAGFYTLGPCLGFAVFAALFETGVASGLSVLFFRGLVLAGVAFVVTFAALALGRAVFRLARLGTRDAFGAAVLSLSFNVCFLVVIPVTVDRSISVFVLGAMAAEPDQTFSADDMSRLFARVYVGEYRQIERRLHEQALTGNVEKIGDAYRISARGRAFIAMSKRIAWVFGGDTRLVTPPSPPDRR